MDQHGVAPARWSARSFATWFVALLVAATVGIVVTIVAAPAELGHDLFDSPLLVPSIGVLAVLCGFAGWFVPAGAPYWGLAVAAPYFVGFFIQVGQGPAGDASFAPVGLVLLFVGMLVPWGVGFAVGVSRRAGRHR